MKDFTLTNLRQLSTEEQLKLNGGTLPVSCSCSCTCTCENNAPEATQKEATKKIAKGVKESLGK